MTTRQARPKAKAKAKRKPLLEPPPDDMALYTADEPLRPREVRLAMLYAEGTRSLAECCRQVGLAPDSRDIKERVRHGNIGRAVAQRMRELGLTLDMPLLKIREFYDAKKEVPTVGMVAVDGEPVRVSSTMELRDNDSQRWAAEQTLKLHGAYPTPDAIQGATGPAAVNIIVRGAPEQPQAVGIRIVTVQPDGTGNGHGNGNGHGGNGH